MECRYLSEIVIEGKPTIGSNAIGGDHIMRKFTVHYPYDVLQSNINTIVEVIWGS